METSRVIFEDFERDTVSQPELDRLLANGWRHAGTHFYRYNMAFHKGMLTQVQPLRIPLEKFNPTKSQRRTRRSNEAAGFRVVIRPTEITREKEKLFEEHKAKFIDNVPDSIFDFLSQDPDMSPCPGGEVSVYDEDRLIAASFFVIGEESLSTIYGMYDLDYQKHGLGIFTMHLEMNYAQQLGKPLYYHGYCYECPSFYDYKKTFQGVEAFDWNGEWIPTTRKM